ncbi:MAG TPA: dephospho-CoA kinase [Burkholderiales bacterium]|nr:dephospho-CoA kinase [Burkholderiales bacterium]
MTFCVGLTGGIGSGKSAAASFFAELGATVVDTDAISHELTVVGGEALPALRSAFGPEYINAEGALDRARMRKLVFGDPAARKKLEGILHPLIRAESRARIAAARGAYAVLVVPLLLETGSYRDVVKRVVVVDCNEATQIERTMARSRLSADEVRAIMRMQLPRGERLALADDVLSNDTDIEALRAQVVALHATYLRLAQSSPAHD